jgi:hypothetical protein
LRPIESIRRHSRRSNQPALKALPNAAEWSYAADVKRHYTKTRIIKTNRIMFNIEEV